MNLLVLKGFNNYFNRKIKKYSEVNDYVDNSSLSYTFIDINFNPNDGVVTEQVLGSEDQLEEDSKILNWENDGSPDYIVCYESEFIHNDDEPDVEIKHIKSRWFVLESVRTRAGQYKLALKRDVIADHLEQILTNPCFVEKGYVQPNNPLIFNQEGVSFNEIKQSPEHKLWDETGIPWLVLYIAKNFPASDTPNVDANGNLPIVGNTVADVSTARDYDELPWSNIENGISSSSTNITRRIAGAGEINISPIVAYNLDITGFGKYEVFPIRINLRNVYNGADWVADNNTSNVEKIGTKQALYDSPLGASDGYTLQRHAIGLTPGTTTVRWNSTGVVVPTFDTNYNPSNLEDLSKASIYEDIYSKINAVYKEMGLSDRNYVSKRTEIKTYLNTKKTYFEGDVSHAPVPGQTNMEAYVGGNQTFLPASILLSYNNTIVKSGPNYYRIKITRQNVYSRPIDYFTLSGDTIVPSSNNNLSTSLTRNNHIQTQDLSRTYYVNSDNTMVETFLEHAWFDIKYERITTDKLKMILDKPGTRIGLNEAAYDMLCLPYGAIDYVLPNDANTQDLDVATSSKEASIGMARSIASQLGIACYDMQLLPYCPYRQVVEHYVEDGYVNLGLTRPFPTGCWFGVYSVTNDSDQISRINRRSFGLYCPNCSGTFDIFKVDSGSDDEKSIDELLGMSSDMSSEDIKVFNACKKFRLVAPNYSSVFEFNPLKNLGVTKFNVDFNYRPYNPYIHINPDFRYLYGEDTNDQRGLILQGDFSVGYYSDKWADYQIQNANYANIFNRQLQNIDANQALEREQTRTQYGVNIATEFLGLGGGLKGASAGSAGGPWGALIGGIAGTVGGGAGSIVGATLDERWMGMAQKESRSYAIDMYNLNLGNVKALPYGLAKSDTLTENFKYVPFIEIYECTPVEEEIMRSKIIYDGMTVDAIGTIQSYIPTENWELQKIKGRMIMMDNISDDFHIANDIYEEVDKGFYLVNTEEGD